MAQATTYRFSKFLILLGNAPTTPEVFEDPCGLTSRGFTRTANLQSTNVPDCADPDLPAYLEQDVVSYEWSLAGSGVVAEESVQTWEDWWESGDPKNIQIKLDGTLDLVWEGAAFLQQLTYTAERGQRVNIAVNIVGSGPVALNAALLAASANETGKRGTRARRTEAPSEKVAA